jgi:hypothetical protein
VTPLSLNEQIQPKIGQSTAMAAAAPDELPIVAMEKPTRKRAVGAEELPEGRVAEEDCAVDPDIFFENLSG